MYMIAYISGRVMFKREETVVLDVGGVGYEAWCPPQILEDLQQGTEQKLYTVHIVREDSQTLYGFLTQGQKELFQLLLGVSGIGPKNALKIMGKVSGGDIIQAIIQQDSSVLEALGIGKKIADRMIVELKGKSISGDGVSGGENKTNGFTDEAQALIALGYTARDVIDALKRTQSSDMNERIKEALKLLGK
ncbi:MAG: Holliday junction DNA helicase RuvA [Parcubacteria group bacterium GW2011_GWA2_43_13]|nr:MAG: Holliday junction DNA helicase RuvA [Parcubacteria group bacterium GW2011_GWA2_43_13]HAZ16519.1 Holliday junction branch migration protein RuvA [Candidatus Jacksonbacteria bacterium]